jgi:hypothetical protein
MGEVLYDEVTITSVGTLSLGEGLPSHSLRSGTIVALPQGKCA